MNIMKLEITNYSKTLMVLFHLFFLNCLLYSQVGATYDINLRLIVKDNLILLRDSSSSNIKDYLPQKTIKINDNYLICYFSIYSDYVGLVNTKNNGEKIIKLYNSAKKINDSTWYFRISEHLNEYGETVKEIIDTMIIKGNGGFY